MANQRMEHATGCSFPRGLEVCNICGEGRLAVRTHPQSISTCESNTPRYGSTEIDSDSPDGQRPDAKDKQISQSGDEGSTEKNPNIHVGQKTDATDGKTPGGEGSTDSDPDSHHTQKTVATDKTPQSNQEDKNSSKTHTGLTTESVRAGNVKIVKHKCDINLIRACLEGKLNVVKHIISLGLADINCRREDGYTPVMCAVMRGHVTVFKYLFNQGCDLSLVTKNNDTVLHVAVDRSYPHIDIVRTIVDSGKCDIDSRGGWGRTPVMLAASLGKREAFELLVGKGCNLTPSHPYKDNILHLACKGGHLDIVQYILSQNLASLESRGNRGYTPVMAAISASVKLVVELLIKEGCNLKVMDDEKNNILHVACYNGWLVMVKYLMTLRAVKGMEKAKNERGYTPVQVAERTHHTAVAMILKGWKYR